MSKFSDLIGTSLSYFRIGLTGPRIKSNAGTIEAKNAVDSAFVGVKALIMQATGNTIELNANAAATGTDYKYSLARPSTGMAAAVTLTLPATSGTAGQVLQTDGAGNLSYVAAGSTASCQTTDTTSIAFGSTSPVAMFTLPVNAVVNNVRVIVDAVFNGTPSLSIGIAGTTSKYMAATQMDLSTIGVYEAYPGIAALGTTEAIIATYSAGAASSGAGRIEIDYSVPQ